MAPVPASLNTSPAVRRNNAAARYRRDSSRNARNAAAAPRDYPGPGPGPGASLSEYRDTLMSDPAQLADLVSVAPARENGRFIGYTVRPGRDADFLTRYGLMPGDVVTSVNGIRLDSPSQAFGVMRDLASAKVLDLEVQRNGQVQHFSIPMN